MIITFTVQDTVIRSKYILTFTYITVLPGLTEALTVEVYRRLQVMDEVTRRPICRVLMSIDGKYYRICNRSSNLQCMYAGYS